MLVPTVKPPRDLFDSLFDASDEMMEESSSIPEPGPTFEEEAPLDAIFARNRSRKSRWDET